MVQKSNKRKAILTATLASTMLIGGCSAIESPRMNLNTYAPVIDVAGNNYDPGTYNNDLAACRQLGITVQARYDEQRQSEQKQAAQTALLGAAAGAVLGSVLGSGRNNTAVTTGALYGGALGAAVGVEGIDYSRTLAKFGPTGIVDRCMTDRGYKILSAEGYGGG